MVKLVKYKCIFHCDLHVVQVFWVKDSIIMQYQIHLYMGASIKQTKKNIFLDTLCELVLAKTECEIYVNSNGRRQPCCMNKVASMTRQPLSTSGVKTGKCKLFEFVIFLWL